MHNKLAFSDHHTEITGPDEEISGEVLHETWPEEELEFYPNDEDRPFDESHGDLAWA